MRYKCPVCAFESMPYPAVPYNICPCCGTEFGVDDRLNTLDQIRQDWVVNGMPWFDDITSPPPNWSPLRQLLEAGLGELFVSPIGSVTTTTQKNIYLPTRTFWSVAELSAYPVTVGA